MNSLKILDLRHLWHPFTQQNEWKKDLERNQLIIRSGKGVYLTDIDGNKIIDGVSSLWCNLHGHQHPALDAAVKKQLKKITHSTFLGLSHEPGIRLANELLEILPPHFSRIFYSDNGSTSVEVALKMAFQYHTQKLKLKTQGSKRTEFLALKNSYHGDTIGSVSVGGTSLFHKKFKPLLFKTHFAMSPHCAQCPFKMTNRQESIPNYYEYNGEKPRPGDFRKETGCRWECLNSVETILKKNYSKIAGAILEPIVQAAGGMIVMPPGYLKGFADLCKKYDILLILDEVATGFGRTGKMFACEHEPIKPDFICLSKGITGGYLPLAATCTTEKIYKAFLGKYEEYKTFFHGHTYTANPLACEVSRANLKILKKNKTIAHVNQMAGLLKVLLKDLSVLPYIGESRQAGLMAGIELVKNKKTGRSFPPSLRLGKKICFEARRRGLFLRPLGDVIVLMPPLIIQESEMKKMIRILKDSILSVTQSSKIQQGTIAAD